MILTSVWLLASPWVLDFAADSDPLLGNVLTGGVVILALAMLGWISASRPRRLSVDLILLASGVWLAVAAILYARSVGAVFWSTLLVGAITTLLALISLMRARWSVRS